MVKASRQPSSRRPVGVRIPNPRSPASARQGDNVRHLYVWRGIALAVELLGIQKSAALLAEFPFDVLRLSSADLNALKTSHFEEIFNLVVALLD